MNTDYHCQRALELKRAGKYNESKKAYYDAITGINIKSDEVLPFYGLAKVCYLNNDQNESIQFYLVHMHLSVLNCDKSKSAANIIKNSVDPEIVSEMEDIHKDAIYLLNDPHCPRHLAHSYLDFMQHRFDMYCVNSNSKYVSIYRDSLAGKSDYVDQDIEYSYTTLGLILAARELKWDIMNDSLNINNIIEIYRDTNLNS